MAESLSNHSLGEAISRLIQRLSDADATKTPEELEAMAKEMLEKRKPERKQHEIDVKKKEAEQWVEDATSADADKQKAALEKLDKTQYKGKLTVATAKDRVAQVERVLDVKAPDWLKADSLQHSPQAIEFVARIAELSPELQNDPNVLYLETMRLHRSVDWSTSHEARKEVRAVMDRTFEHIKQVVNDPNFKGDKLRYQRDKLIEPLDPYHIKTLEIEAKAPRKKVEKEEWQKKQKLQSIIDVYQDQFDTAGNINSLDEQAEILQRFIRQLKEGVTPDTKTGQADLPRVAREYLDSAQKRFDVVVKKLQAGGTREQADLNGIPITYAELKGKSWFLSEELSNKDFSNKKDGDVIYKFRYWNPEDVAYLKEHGYEKWFYQYVDRVFGLGAEQKQPGIAEQYVFDEFRYLFSALYGQEVGAVVLQKFQNHWDSRGLLDYITHGMGMGAGNAKTRLELMERFRSANTDELKQFKYANLSFSFFESETFGLMSEKLHEFELRKKWLKENVKNDFLNRNRVEIETRARGVYTSKNPEEMRKLLEGDHGKHNGLLDLYGRENISREDYLKILNLEKLHMSSTDFAKQGHQYAQTEIQLTMDTVARGVVLEDTDVWGYSDVETHLIQTEEKIAKWKRLEKLKSTRELTEDELKSYPAEQAADLEQTRLQLLRQRDQWVDEVKKEMMKPDASQKEITKYLADRRGLSKIEMRVYERMREYLKFQTGHEPDEIDLRMAVWAGRTHIIATGRMASIGAMMARMPGIEYQTGSWKHAMRAPAFEDLVRIMNVEMFADRFGMGGDMGKIMRSYFRFNLRKERMVTGLGEEGASFFDTKQWKEFRSGVQDKATTEMADIMEFAEKDLGIKFSELLAPSFMAAGGQYDGSGWRLDISVLDEIKKFYIAKQQKGEILDNQALAIRYLVAGSVEERMQILERMTERTPSKFFTLLADKRQDMMSHRDVGLIKAGQDQGEVDKIWHHFESALKYAETDLWRNKEYTTNSINLATEGDFNRILRPYLEKMQESGLIDKAQDLDAYRQLIVVMQRTVRSSAPELGSSERGVYKNYLEAIAKEKLPLTLSLDDFDWENTDMKVVGELAYPRRTRDIAAMEKARNIILAFFTNQENTLSPNDPMESIKKMVALRDAIIDYAGPKTAEPVIRQIARLFLEANRDRSLWSISSWTPLKLLMPTLAEMDLRPNEKALHRGGLGKFMMSTVGAMTKGVFGTAAKISHEFKIPAGKDSKGKDRFIRPFESLMNSIIPGWKHFSHEPFEHWPHSIAESISWSVRFTGAHGNRWNEQKMSGVIATMRDVGLFADMPDFEHDLNDEFKAGLGMKALATVRRYWWVALFATAAIATTQSVKEEEKGGGH